MRRDSSSYYSDSEPPDWFNLSNYRCLKSYEVDDWLKALLCRYDLKELSEGREEFECRYPDIDHQAECRRMHGEIIGTLQEDQFPESVDVYSAQSKTPAPAVMQVEPELVLLAESKEGAAKPYLRIPSKFQRHELLAINPRASKEKIKEEFEKWLAEHSKNRRDYQKGRELAPSTINHWISDGLLPYIDIVLRMDIDGIVVTNEQIGRWIFPSASPSTSLSEKVRKTTKPLSEQVLDLAYLVRLEKQIYAEEK